MTSRKSSQREAQRTLAKYLPRSIISCPGLLSTHIIFPIIFNSRGVTIDNLNNKLNNIFIMQSNKTKQQDKLLIIPQSIFVIIMFIFIYIAYQINAFNPLIIFLWNLPKPITLSTPTYDKINSKRNSYIRALNKAISETSFEEPISKQLNTAGCFEFLTSNCKINAVLFFSDYGKKPHIINRLKEFGWEDKTVTNSMIPDTEDRFFRKIGGLAVCLILGRGDGDEFFAKKSELGVKIDMVGFPSKYPTTAELFSGWQLYIPHYSPSRFILKNRSYPYGAIKFQGRLVSENSDKNLTKYGQPHYQYFEFEESKLINNSYYHPCIEWASKSSTNCTLYLTTKGGKKVYIDNTQYDNGETVLHISIDNTYIKISTSGETKDSRILSESELADIVDSFTPVPISECESKIPAEIPAY